MSRVQRLAALLLLAGCSDRVIVIGEEDPKPVYPDGGAPPPIACLGAEPLTWFKQSGSYEARPLYGAGFALADFNRDGKLDLTVMGNLYLGWGDGGLHRPQLIQEVSPEYGTAPVLPGDFDGDGNPDLYLGCDNTDEPDVALGNGDGTFRAPRSCDHNLQNPGFVTDLDGDGKLDVVAQRCDLFSDDPPSCSSNVYALLGNGDGSFRVATRRMGDLETIADFDGDGRVDLFGGCQPYVIAAGVAFGNGDGTFGDADCSQPYASSTLAADLDGDGKPDLARVSLRSDGFAFTPADALTISRGDGAGGFVRTGLHRVGSHPVQVASADFDGDGSLDLVTQVTEIGELRLFLGKGDGTFSFPQCVVVGGKPTLSQAGDFDGDGRPDLVVADADGGFSIWLNRR